MPKHEQYADLVNQLREDCKFPGGLLNPFHIEGTNNFIRHNQINPWTVWQGNLDAIILVIGQDWGSLKYFQENNGCDKDDNLTNIRLQTLLSSIGFDPGAFSHPNPQPLFFTNAILGIREGDYMSGSVRIKWLEHGNNYTKALLEIIQPKVIITLGAIPLKAIRMLYPDIIPEARINDMVMKNPYHLSENQKLFAMYHCGALGIANLAKNSGRNGWEAMKEIWASIE